MNNLICSASVSDTSEFPSASHRDTVQSIGSVLLGIWRAFAVVFFSLFALVHNTIMIPFVRRPRRVHARSAWLHRWCQFACCVLGLRVTTHGTIPSSGLLVSNHLSYLDIVVLSSIRPCIFVAKRDVASWPLFGWLAQVAGTVFVDRNRKFGTPKSVDVIGDAIGAGSVVVLFPEGTSSDGSTVLPFKSALLESAVQLRCPIAAASIDYGLNDGSVADEVCYWREMTLVPHLLNLFFKREIRANYSFSPTKVRGGNRKEIARELRDEVVSMRS
jgi:lyso-ornithine lipid O-acyltransferase